MFTLIYHNGQFNRPDTLLPFLQANVGMSPLIQIDCIMPYKGTAGQLMDVVCEYLSKQDPSIQVIPNIIQNRSAAVSENGQMVSYLVIQVHVMNR